MAIPLEEKPLTEEEYIWLSTMAIALLDTPLTPDHLRDTLDKVFSSYHEHPREVAASTYRESIRHMASPDAIDHMVNIFEYMRRTGG
jgi:hypothetical protein